MPGLLKPYNQGRQNVSGVTRQSYKANPPVNELPSVCPRCLEIGKKFYTHKVNGLRYYHDKCADCYTYLYRKEWRRKEKIRNPEREYLRLKESQLKVKYGLTLEGYQTLLASQGDGCAICGANDSGYSRKKSPAYVLDMPVDHCHTTGLNRGILCHKCNKLLGFAGDDVEKLRKAVQYIEEWKMNHNKLTTKV